MSQGWIREMELVRFMQHKIYAARFMQGTGLCCCGRWRGKSEIPGAGCREGSAGTLGTD